MPEAWKVGVIHLLGKKGKEDPSQPSHFHPITLTSYVGKVFTEVQMAYLHEPESVLEHISAKGFCWLLLVYRISSSCLSLAKQYLDKEAQVLNCFANSFGAFIMI